MQGFDLLYAGGNYTAAYMRLPHLTAQLSYTPGTIVELAGALVPHSVERWIGGERFCKAHFIRKALLRKAGIPLPTLPVHASVLGV